MTKLRIIPNASTKQMFEINKQVEALILEKGAERNSYSGEELAFVNQYAGYGGMGKFVPSDFDNKQGLLYEYYTELSIVKKMVGLAYQHGYKQGGKVLEPSIGIGNFAHFFSPETPMVGYERNSVSATIAALNFPTYDILNQYFNELFIDRRGNLRKHPKDFDLVIGNPPYGEFIGKFTKKLKKAWKINTYVDFFILGGAKVLKKGGLLIYIIPSAFLKGSETQVKREILNRLDLVEAWAMPKSIFSQTDIQTDIVVFRKK